MDRRDRRVGFFPFLCLCLGFLRRIEARLRAVPQGFRLADFCDARSERVPRRFPFGGESGEVIGEQVAPVYQEGSGDDFASVAVRE